MPELGVQTTTDDVLEAIDLTGKVAIVTVPLVDSEQKLPGHLPPKVLLSP